MSAAGAVRRAAVAAILLGATLCASAAAGNSRLITSTSIAAAPLGATQSEYTRILGKITFSTTLPGNVRRLTFLGGDVSVNLRKGHGYALLTSSSRYRTAAGVGPCASVASLKRAYKHLVPVRVKGSPGVPAYVSGHVLFVTPSNKVGAVMLANNPLDDLRLALNAPACGGAHVG